MRILIAILTLISTGYSLAQEVSLIKGRVTDTEGHPVANASVKVLSEPGGTVTDKDGYFVLSTLEEDFELRFSSIGYKSIIKTFYGIAPKSVLTIDVKMEINITLLKELEVISEKGPETVYAKPDTYLLDFELTGDNFVFLLSFKRKQCLRLVDGNDSILVNIPDPYNSDELYKDCMGNLYLVNADSAYQFYIQPDNSVHFYRGISFSKLETVLKPCILSVGDNFVFDQGMHSLTASYIMINRITHLRKYIQTIRPDTRDLLEAQYLLAKAPSGTGELTSNQLHYRRFIEQKEWLYKSMLPGHNYNPLVYANDSLYIFNHIKDTMYVYTRNGDLIRWSHIFYHKDRRWKRLTFTDENRESVYTVFARSGIFELRKINLQDGSVSAGHKVLEHTYPQKIRIKGNYAYYLYKDKYDYWSNKNFYRQRIN
jgi:hypothetical protein